MDEALLFAAARRSYELGRVRVSLRRAALATPIAALPLYHCMQTGGGATTMIGIACFAVLVALFTWRGEGYGRGVRTGMVAGLGPLLLPLLSTWTGLLCSKTVCGILPATAVVGGCLGGLALAAGAWRQARHGWGFWFSAVAITVTLGSVGCLHAGLAGLGGMALGLLAGTLPSLAWRAMTAR